MYLRKYSIAEISKGLNVSDRTLYNWREVGEWDKMLAHESAEAATVRRYNLLLERENKTTLELDELDRLVVNMSKFKKMSHAPQKQAVSQPQQGEGAQRVGKGGSATKGGGSNRKKKIKNDVSFLTLEDFKKKFHGRFYDYQNELYAQRHLRNRQILKSRQIGATWYFSQESFEDATLEGNNQIFLSATRAQSEVFRSYIINLVGEAWDIELKGNPIKLHTANGPATLYFLSNNSKSAQSYHGNVYIDEYFWITKFAELYKVATGMAAHKKWRRTLFSTPSAVNHAAYPYWSGDLYNSRFKKKRVEFPGFKERQSGILCPDNTWRKIITLKDAEKGGCDLFDMKDLKLEYSPEEFQNLFMCEFVDDTFGVFKLKDLEECYSDHSDWEDFKPKNSRPYGHAPVWCGYDPSRTHDDACFVVLAPPVNEDDKFRVLERHKWVDKSFSWQAGQIKKICSRYNVQHLAVDRTGPGLGVFETVKTFYPRAVGIHYSLGSKNELVTKAREVLTEGRIEWDAAMTDIAHSFLTIRQTATSSGHMTYSAGRTDTTGHADVAWAIMHALSHEPIAQRPGQSGVRVAV